jgi:hypothetical protein
MAVSGWSAWSLRFHDWTSYRAWPRVPGFQGETLRVPSRHHGILTVHVTAPGIYSVRHPAIGHTYTTNGADVFEAVERAENWFTSLADVGIYPEGVRS